ncbi:hypothetical protein Dimus_023025 [Dionaea muscipula]
MLLYQIIYFALQKNANEEKKEPSLAEVFRATRKRVLGRAYKEPIEDTQTKIVIYECMIFVFFFQMIVLTLICYDGIIIAIIIIYNIDPYGGNCISTSWGTCGRWRKLKPCGIDSIIIVTF